MQSKEESVPLLSHWCVVRRFQHDFEGRRPLICRGGENSLVARLNNSVAGREAIDLRAVLRGTARSAAASPLLQQPLI